MKSYISKNLALFAILAAVLLGGGVTVLTKVTVKEIPPFSYTFLRFFIAGLVILPFFLRDKPTLRKNMHKVFFFSLFLSANVILAPWGIQHTTATIAQTLYVFVPIMVAVLSYFILAERFTQKKLIGIWIGFLGALIIILLPVLTQGNPFNGGFVGNVITFAGVVCTALYTVYSKPFQKQYTPIQITSIFIFITCIISFFFALTDLQTHANWWKNVTPIAAWSTLYIAILGTSLWYLLYQYAIKHGSPVIASMTLYLQPAATFIWASLLLGEQLTIGLIIGALLAFTGVYLTLHSKKINKQSELPTH